MPQAFVAVTLPPQPTTDSVSHKNTTAQQEAATRFSLDYLNYLLQQEQVMDGMLERKLHQLELSLDKRIDEQIEKRLMARQQPC